MLSAIYLDIDGVLGDFHGAWCDIWGVDHSYVDRITSWDQGLVEPFKEASGGRLKTISDIWPVLEEAGFDFWANLKMLPWGKELLNLCRAHAPVVIMTAPTLDPMSAAGKVAWIQKNIPDAQRFAITPCKHHMSHPGALLIDDSPHGCEQFNQFGGTSYLFPRPWNNPNWRDVDFMTEIEATIHRLK